MRILERNKQLIYYSLYVKKEAILDEYGNSTGQYKVIYGDPTPFKANIAYTQGEKSIQQFGIDINYDKVIVTTDMDCPIAETSILWIDNLDTSKPHDYIVSQVARSLNSISITVKKVDINA